MDLHCARPPCPSLSPRVCSNPCPLSRWCHPTILPSVIPFFSCLQSFPVSGSFPVHQLFTSGGQSIETSASASVLSMNIHHWDEDGKTRTLLLYGVTHIWQGKFLSIGKITFPFTHMHIDLLRKPRPQVSGGVWAAFFFSSSQSPSTIRAALVPC